MDVIINTALIPRLELRVLCAAFLEATLRFYEVPENRTGFERWLEGEKGGNADGQEDSGKAAEGISEPCTAPDSVPSARSV